MNTDDNFDIVYSSLASVTTSGHIKDGEFITSNTDGVVHACQIVEILTDPLGDLHFPDIFGYAVDDIDGGQTGRAVIDCVIFNE